jgi:hypothetical protein
VRSSSVRWVLMLIGALAFVAGGVFMLRTDASAPAAWAAIVFFGACGLMAIVQILDRRPRLVIDDRGVLDRMLNVGVIEWHDIEGAAVKRLHGNAFICLELRDPLKYTRRLSSIGRRLAEVNRGLGYTPIVLNLAGTDLDPERVCELLVKEATARRGRWTA